VTDEKRGLHLYELALSLVETKGVPVTVGATTLREYRGPILIIHYMPRSGHLDVWYRRKVLTINRWKGSLQVAHYGPGENWEEELEAAAAKSPSKR
jgi:hypothetical protein